MGKENRITAWHERHNYVYLLIVMLLTTALTACDSESSDSSDGGVQNDGVEPSPGLGAFPRAIPSEGVAPLTVSLYPDATIDSVIETFQWDFDNDGVYDISEPIGRVQSYLFEQPGTYTVRLSVTNLASDESIGEIIVTVANAPPEVTADATPSNGSIPLTVNFSASAGDNEGIALYEWDFDGNGSIDESSETTGSTSHIYTSVGVYRPTLTVSDSLGEKTKLQVPTLEVRARPENSPVISVSASPVEGTAPLSVTFNARVSDPERQAVVQWDWDFDGNDTIDTTDIDSGRATFTYTTPGEFFVRVQATMEDGDKVVDYIRVIVQQEITLAVSNDTIDTELAQSATINTTLSGDSRISLLIEDGAGVAVRTLVDNEQRASGSYGDVWDGLNNRGQRVSAGQYRAVLIHGDEATRFDLGLTTGDFESNPIAEYDTEFAAFAANPLEINYALDQASEVTAFLGFLGAGTGRVFTFFQRQPKGRGSHQIIWNGENEEGMLIDPPEDSSGFLIGMFAYTLPDNAIVVKNAVGLNSLAAAPPILIPDSVTGDGSARLSTLQFNLNRDAQVTHTVNNADSGEQIFRKVYERILSGSPQLFWEGKNNEGTYVAPGNYRHGVTAIDSQGNKSTTLYAMQRVYY